MQKTPLCTLLSDLRVSFLPGYKLPPSALTGDWGNR